jgi:hypothetical protein
MYVRDEHTGKIKVDDSDFHVEKYRTQAEYQEIEMSRSEALTDCIRKALRVMSVRHEVEGVFKQRGDLTDRWLSCWLYLGSEDGDPLEVWAQVDFTFFPESDNPNVTERMNEKAPIFGEAFLENLREATHLREVDLPTLGLEIANRLINSELKKETIEGESLLVIVGAEEDGQLIYEPREPTKRICSMGFETIEHEKEIMLDGEEVTVEKRVFYSWADVVGG